MAEFLNFEEAKRVGLLGQPAGTVAWIHQTQDERRRAKTAAKTAANQEEAVRVHGGDEAVLLHGEDEAAPPYLTLTPASSIRIDRPRWVWDRRIPVGGTTLMPGREGLGKTLLACHLGARLTRGQLAGEWWGRPAHVVYIGHEDDRATVLVPRLVAAGADLDRFLFVDIPAGGTFRADVDLAALHTAATGRGVALIIVDPLDSHLGAIDSHKKAEVQSTVARLADLAQALRCGALGLAHFNKAAITDLLARVVGSVGFTTGPRSVLAVGEHPDDPNERVCVCAKANMTDRSTVPALRFRTESTAVPHPDGGEHIDTGGIVIVGEEHGLDPNSLLAGDSEERNERQSATAFLLDTLDEVGTLSSEVEDRALHGHDISKRTLVRARKELGVVAFQKDRKWYLRLPSECQGATHRTGTLSAGDDLEVVDTTEYEERHRDLF